MQSVALSSKFQLSIPKAVREAMGLKPGQRFTIVNKGGVLEFVPQRQIRDARGMVKGPGTGDYRDRTDRY